MHTISLKADDVFFENLNSLTKEFKTTKSKFIRDSVDYYNSFLKKQKIKNNLKLASKICRDSSGLESEILFNNDWLKNV